MPNFNLLPDWDEDNVLHIARHNLSPEQVEEVYYSEGSFFNYSSQKEAGPPGKRAAVSISGELMLEG